MQVAEALEGIDLGKIAKQLREENPTNPVNVFILALWYHFCMSISPTIYIRTELVKSTVLTGSMSSA